MNKASIILTIIVITIIILSILAFNIPHSKIINPLVYQTKANDTNYNLPYPANSPYVIINTQGMRQQNFASGFYISPYIVATCEHVLRYDNLFVNGKRASVLSRNVLKDIALLKVSVENVNYLKLSPMVAKQGQSITVFSNPLGLNNTESVGIISNPYRILSGEQSSVIQFTAPVSEGSSGGAILNGDGEIIGMVKETIKDGQLLNFAIPAAQIQQELNNITPDQDYNNYYYNDYNP